ncbi:MAG: acetate/propionate family kinase [Candidatus Dormibacteraeota bacterium]|nr:acetate/propionate family kinase [Candidatus Dormibacteraeota bacterium]
MRILAVNKGSSSLKYLLADVEAGEVARRAHGQAESVDALLAGAGRAGIDAVGHRIVHGGPDFTQPVPIDDAMIARLQSLADLAPLHNPPAVAAVREMLAALPGVPAYAVFDTAFHATLSRAAATYAVPLRWRSDYGVRRYGFHGLAHRWMAERAAVLLGRPLPELRIITLQLGSGASACAIAGGHSVDTSMGMTPAEGLVMASRSGDVDPLLVQHLVRVGAGTADQLWTALERESGLTGLTGVGDMAEILRRDAAGDRDAELAIAVYCLRIRHYVGAYLAELGGADAIVFGGGVGEHAAPVRWRSLTGMGWAGIDLDAQANDAARGEAKVSTPSSPTAVFICPVDEESLICRDVAAAAGPQ